MKIGLDLGTATLRVADEKRGVVLREACVIGDGLSGMPTFVVGNRAEKMIGRTPPHMKAVCPMGRGVVSAPRASGELLKELLPKAVGWRWKWRPSVVAAVPARITESQKGALIRALKFAGASSVELMAKPVAAALGAEPQTGRSHATMVVDVGAETTEVAALSPGIIVCESIQVGGRHFDEAIQAHLRNVHHLEIDVFAAESLKRELGTAHPLKEVFSAQVSGREMETGLPHSVQVTGKEIREAIQGPLSDILTLVRQTLDTTPAGLSADILEHGLVLTGGGALLQGLDQYLSAGCDLKVRVAENPGDCAVLGLLKTMESITSETTEKK